MLLGVSISLIRVLSGKLLTLAPYFRLLKFSNDVELQLCHILLLKCCEQNLLPCINEIVQTLFLQVELEHRNR